MTGRDLVYEERPQVSTEPYLAFGLVTRLGLLIFLRMVLHCSPACFDEQSVIMGQWSAAWSVRLARTVTVDPKTTQHRCSDQRHYTTGLHFRVRLWFVDTVL